MDTPSPAIPGNTPPDPHSTRHFWIVVGIPLTMFILAFPLVKSNFFKKYCDVPTITLQTALHETSNAHCDILIYGDSTAQRVVDPAVVQARTHLDTCNVGATGVLLPLVGSEPLDRFLARNSRPKYLVLQFSGARLNDFRTQPVEDQLVDGVIPVLRYFGWKTALKSMLLHPEHLLGVFSYAYQQGAKEAFEYLIHKRGVAKWDKTSTFHTPPASGLPFCQPFLGGTGLPDPAWIAHMRQEYAAKADHVLVDISPTSSCNGYFPEWVKRLGNATDNKPELFPQNNFIDGFFHTTQAGSQRVSEELADQLVALENEDAHTTLSTPDTEQKRK